MPTQLTPEGKVVLYHAETGQRITRWPVDARSMVACGEYTTEPPAGAEPAPAETPAPPAIGTTATTAHALGVPLVVTHAHDAPPGQPMQEPVRSKGRRA